jgi:hypothetical protein
VLCICFIDPFMSHILSTTRTYSQTSLGPCRRARCSGRTKSRSAKGNPFGAAVPREQVLKTRGIDASVMDASIERKANVLHFTSEQEAELEAVRVALTKAEKDLPSPTPNVPYRPTKAPTNACPAHANCLRHPPVTQNQTTCTPTTTPKTTKEIRK